MRSTLFVFYAAAVLLTAGSAYFDWRRRQVPNWVTASALLLGPAAWALRGAASAGTGPALLGALSVLGAALCAAVPLLLFRFSMIGGADVKLLASLGALLLPQAGLRVELVALLIAAALLPARLAYRGTLLATAWRTASLLWRVSFRPKGGPIDPPAAMTERVLFSPFVLAATLLLPVTGGPP